MKTKLQLAAETVKQQAAVAGQKRGVAVGSTDWLAGALVEVLDARALLKTRTNAELVAECLKTDAADYLVVMEMMDRLDPGWENEKPANDKLTP